MKNIYENVPVKAAVKSCMGVLLFLSSSLLYAQHPARTVLDGVYTEAQAERGQQEYEIYCGDGCHGLDLDGGNPPPLHTSLFLDAWREDYLSTLYDFMQTRMPKSDEHEEGSLSEQQYLDILAYILLRNKFPTGAQELTHADLTNTLLVGLKGPEPLPPSAMVRVTGCFAKVGEDWYLQHGTFPARVRVADETDAVELAKSADAVLGTLDFKLNNLDEDHKDDELQKRLAQKVQVKGVMNGEQKTARLYVLSFETVGEHCDAG